MAMKPIQITGPFKKYDSIGECIYCGSSEKKLEKEHILPYGIAGHGVIFRGASCRDCADFFLRQFERQVLTKQLGPFRFKVGAPTRHKRDRPEQMGVNFVYPAPPGIPPLIYETRNFSPEHYPIGLTLLRLKAPKILTNNIAFAGDLVDAWSNHYMDQIKKLVPSGAPRTISMGEINPLNFARFLAKIAFAYAVAELGKNAFEPMILPLIFGKTEIMTDLVGGDYEIAPPTEALHELQYYICDMGSVRYQCVRIRLFANFGASTYHVVVGPSLV